MIFIPQAEIQVWRWARPSAILSSVKCLRTQFFGAIIPLISIHTLRIFLHCGAILPRVQCNSVSVIPYKKYFSGDEQVFVQREIGMGTVWWIPGKTKSRMNELNGNRKWLENSPTRGRTVFAEENYFVVSAASSLSHRLPLLCCTKLNLRWKKSAFGFKGVYSDFRWKSIWCWWSTGVHIRTFSLIYMVQSETKTKVLSPRSAFPDGQLPAKEAAVASLTRNHG